MERKELVAAVLRRILVSLVEEIVMMVQSALGTLCVVTTTAGIFTPLQVPHMIAANLDLLMVGGRNGPPGQHVQKKRSRECTKP